MRGINATVYGNIVADFEIATFQDKKTGELKEYVRGRVASPKPMQKRTSDKDKAYFINVVCWGKGYRDNISHYRKGSSIMICGVLTENPYIDKAGNPRSGLEITPDDITFVGSKAKDEGTQNDAAPAASPQVDPTKPVPQPPKAAHANATPVPQPSPKPNPSPAPKATPTANPQPQAAPSVSPQVPSEYETPLSCDLDEDFDG